MQHIAVVDGRPSSSLGGKPWAWHVDKPERFSSLSSDDCVHLLQDMTYELGVLWTTTLVFFFLLSLRLSGCSSLYPYYT